MKQEPIHEHINFSSANTGAKINKYLAHTKSYCGMLNFKKPLLLLLIAVFCTAPTYADCAGTGLSVFPNGPVIRQNSIFMVEGYAESQNVILELNKKHNIYLKIGKKRVKLLVTEICVGQFFLTQAILKPETELEAGVEYTMHIDDLPEYERFNKYNNATHKYEQVKYKVIKGKDLDRPKISSRSMELKKTLVQYGCGPAIHVVFTNPSKDQSDIIVKTTVKNLKTGKETTYYIKPDRDKIKVGHEMCSGAFDFDGDFYEVEFSYMDASGNITVWTGERIKFTKPLKETDHNDE